MQVLSSNYLGKNYKSEEDICNEIINSNLSNEAKIKAIQALKNEKEIKEEQDNELVLCEG
jgi:hypothetical protein